MPYLKAAGELKTKPTQHSVGQLRQIGIQPDMLICRTERSLSREDREKIALFCNVPIEAVIEEKDKDFSIYEVPLSLVDNGLDELIVDSLGLPAGKLDLDDWRDLLHNAAQSRARNQRSPWSANTPSIATPTSRSTKRSTTPASPIGPRSASSGFRANRSSSEGPERLLAGYDGMLVPGGFGERGIEGKVEAIRFARERRDSVLRHLPGNAVRGDRICPQRDRPGRGPFDRVQQGHAPSGDLPARRAEDDHRQGGHDAAGRPAGHARPGQPGGRVLRHGDDLRAASPSLRVQQRLPPAIRGQRHARSPAPVPTARWSRSSSCQTIRGSWPCSSIRNSNRSRPRPIRCLPASSARRSSGMRRAAARPSGCESTVEIEPGRPCWL